MYNDRASHRVSVLTPKTELLRSLSTLNILLASSSLPVIRNLITGPKYGEFIKSENRGENILNNRVYKALSLSDDVIYAYHVVL